MSSIREVAREAGVSIATVSRVLNGRKTVNADLRRKVLRAAEQCSYQPTVGKRTYERVAMLYPGPFCIGSPYDSACMEGVVTAMRQSPYDLVVLDINRDRNSGESASQFLARKGVCGAIVRSTQDQREMVTAMADEGLPLVVLGDHFDHPNIHFCYADSRAASREAVEHLVSLGHESIAFAACDREDGDHQDRFEAYRQVLEGVGLYKPDFVHRVPPSRMDGAPLIRRILSKSDRPTALFVADPLVAVGVLNEAHALGVRVPEDLSVVAVDDADVRNMVFPRMTAVCQDSMQLGQEAFETICRLMDGDSAQEIAPRRQQAWFEIHDSAGPPTSNVKRFLPNNRSAALA